MHVIKGKKTDITTPNKQINEKNLKRYLPDEQEF
uniref:Uncharacterized protein n=1 Tax=Rhizophora mucronata TaxID=61149 RepID=A0A2P2PBZ6_RHIMU